MAILCKNLKSEDPMVWIMEQFVPLCNLVEDVLYIPFKRRRCVIGQGIKLWCIVFMHGRNSFVYAP